MVDYNELGIRAKEAYVNYRIECRKLATAAECYVDPSIYVDCMHDPDEGLVILVESAQLESLLYIPMTKFFRYIEDNKIEVLNVDQLLRLSKK